MTDPTIQPPDPDPAHTAIRFLSAAVIALAFGLVFFALHRGETLGKWHVAVIGMGIFAGFGFYRPDIAKGWLDRALTNLLPWKKS